MQNRHLEAAMVVQDVRTGSLVVFASSRPADLEVSTQVFPLSLSKVYLAASWWDHNQPDQAFESKGPPGSSNPGFARLVKVNEMLVGGSDSAGKKMAIALRRAIGTEGVLADLHRYGFNTGDAPLWGYVDPAWKTRLTPL